METPLIKKAKSSNEDIQSKSTELIRVKKYSGDLVPFNPEKFRFSLTKSGASSQAVDDIVHSILPIIYDGIHTKELYRLAHTQLRRRANSFAARYSLKRALRDLGPSGFHFEEWIARIFRHMGYETLTGQILAGRAVSHEIDVLARKDEELTIVECKFKNSTEAKTSVTTPMYFLSRLKDLESLSFPHFNKNTQVKSGWLVTNAYFTSDSINFAAHYGVQLLSWDYPEGNSIKNRVDFAGLYPLTCLTTLTKAEKKTLLDKGCILVKDLVKDEGVLDGLRLSKTKERKILEEAQALIEIA